MNTNMHPFSKLVPEKILSAVEAMGFALDGSLFTLNSYENRVYELGLEASLDNAPDICSNPNRIIAKFYRPNRWTEAALKEEHSFLQELHEAEVPVVYPMKSLSGHQETLHYDSELEMYIAVFPKVGGRNMDECGREDLEQLGRLIARLHNVGGTQAFLHRQHINVESFGKKSLQKLEAMSAVPASLEAAFFSGAEQFIEAASKSSIFENTIRVHGDCHAGNVLKNREQLFFLDFDDAAMAPPIQDMFMLVDLSDQNSDLELFIHAYEQMRPFDYSSLKQVWVLRGLRLLQYNAWLSERQDDPAFQQASFDFFKSQNYWQDQCRHLQELLQSSTAPVLY